MSDLSTITANGRDTPILPAHIEETVRAIADLHAEHHQSATPLQRMVARMVSLLGRPAFIGLLSTLVLCWITGNLLVLALGRAPIDPPPFPWLGAAVSLGALYMAVLILVTQRHDDRLTQHREQLTLELAILSEQKTAKIIELLEEMRRDDPTLRNRFDDVASAMSKPADPQSVLNAIKQSQTDVTDPPASPPPVSPLPVTEQS